jgi:hypothetical protein
MLYHLLALNQGLRVPGEEGLREARPSHNIALSQEGAQDSMTKNSF